MGIFDRFRKKPAEQPAASEDTAATGEAPTVETPAPSETPHGGAAEPAFKAPAEETPAAEEPDAEEPVAEEPAAEAVSEAAAAPAEKKSFWGRLRSGLKKTSDLLQTDIRDLLKTEGELVDDAFLSRLYAILIKTDMGVSAANEIKTQIQTDFRGRKVQLEDVLKVIREKFEVLLAQPEQPINFAAEGPTIVMVVGVNGSGKTTSIAKLTKLHLDQGKKVVLGAGDTFRAAAVEQLTIWAERLGAEIVKGEQGGDPASVAHRAVAQARESGADICIIDTAGRLQTQSNLMDQLAKIYRVIRKQVPEAPHEVLLVLDATAGQNAISQAKGFSEAAECTGIMLAKLDGTAKGGVVVPIRQQFDLPVKFIGVGETPEDIEPFQVDRFVKALFDATPGAPK